MNLWSFLLFLLLTTHNKTFHTFYFGELLANCQKELSFPIVQLTLWTYSWYFYIYTLSIILFLNTNVKTDSRPSKFHCIYFILTKVQNVFRCLLAIHNLFWSSNFKRKKNKGAKIKAEFSNSAVMDYLCDFVVS